MENLEKRIKEIKGRKQNQGKSEEEILALAKESLEKEEILGSLTFCRDDEEKAFASNLLKKYLAESSLESTAEKDTLRQLIDIEVLIERVKSYLNTEYAKANPAIPVQMVEQLTYLNKQIIELKEILGLAQKEDQKTILDEWNKLKNKALAYYKEHAGCNVVKCPECKKLFMILKDMRGCTTEKLSWFKKTVLYNKPLFKLYDDKIITKEKLAEILGTSMDYVDLIYENTYKNDR
jgi:hypothetical protein